VTTALRPSGPSAPGGSVAPDRVKIEGGTAGACRSAGRAHGPPTASPRCRFFADRDQVAEMVVERMLAGVSNRQYRRAQEPVGGEIEADERSTSKSAMSPTFVHHTRQLLWNLMNRRLAAPAPAGDYARRDRAARAHEHRGAGDRQRGRQARAQRWDGRPRTRPSPTRCCRT